MDWETITELLSLAPPATTDKASAGWFACGVFDPLYRDSANLVARTALAFDYDRITANDIVSIKRAFKEYEYLIYTTASHTEAAPRLRVILPLARPVSPDEFCAVSRKVAAKAGIELAARESHVPAQMMFMPTRKPNGTFFYKLHKGVWVNPDEILNEYKDWTDRKEWPHRQDADGTYHPGELPQDPREKPGIIGAFCRAFSIPEAIEKFGLPYTKTETEDRWTYTGGSRPEGAIVYDNGAKLHSHHDSDPAHGQHNAFDLVRLHRFPDLGNAERGLGITEQPSFRAMVVLANEQAEVRTERAAAEFDPLPDSPAEAEQGADNQPADGVRETEGSAEVPRLSKFRVIPAQDFATDVPMQWWVKGLLPKAELAVLYGESGSGKSFMALDLAAAISRGVKWREHIVSKGRVVYVAAEGAGGFRQRLRAYARKYDVPLNDLPGIVGDAPNLLAIDDAKALTKEIIKAGGADVIIIDTLARTMPAGNENASEDMSRIIAHCKAIYRATGALVVAVHHSGKDTTKGARGHSSLRAAADAELEVTRNGDFRLLTIRKMKDGSDSEQWGFKLDVVELGFDADGDEITSCIVAPTEARKPPTKEPRGVLQRSVLAIARSLLAEGQGSISAVLDAAVAKMPKNPDAKSDQRRKVAFRALESLVRDQFLQMPTETTISLTTAVPVEMPDE